MWANSGEGNMKSEGPKAWIDDKGAKYLQIQSSRGAEPGRIIVAVTTAKKTQEWERRVRMGEEKRKRKREGLPDASEVKALFVTLKVDPSRLGQIRRRLIVKLKGDFSKIGSTVVKKEPLEDEPMQSDEIGAGVILKDVGDERDERVGPFYEEPDFFQ